jgi:hypothetical protein
MMTQKSEDLIIDLTKRVNESIEAVKSLQQLDQTLLNARLNEQSWSALECIEHLNRYGAFYIPEINQRLKSAKKENSENFKSTWLGNYFAVSLLPKEKLNKMKTFKSMNPMGSQLDHSTITTFLRQQKELLELLELAKTVNLNRVKTNISISKWIKLKCGDTFRVVIYHNQRHIEQAQRAIENGRN